MISKNGSAGTLESDNKVHSANHGEASLPPVLPDLASHLQETTKQESLPKLPNRQDLTPDKATPNTTPTFIRIEKSCDSFTHLHTAIEYAASNAAIRAEELEDASLFQSGRPVVLGITSAIAGEGKTTVALHLAMDIARNNFKRVCLMDMALGEDTLSTRLAVKTGAGLVNVLEGLHHTIPILESDEIEGLCVMPAGKTPTNAARAARSPSVAEVFAASREMFDVIIVDLPAVSTGNTLPIVPYIDALIMVVCAGVTPRDIVESALERLGKKKMLGVVLNKVSHKTPHWIQKRLGRA